MKRERRSKSISWLNPLFAPGVAVMKRLTYLMKFLLIGILLLVPLIAVSALYVTNNGEDRKIHQQELEGMEYLGKIEPLLTLFVEHRSWFTADTRDAEQTKAIEAVQQQIASAVAAVDAYTAQSGVEIGTDSDWKRVKQGWEEIQSSTAELSATESLSWHQSLIEDTVAMMTTVRNKKHLVLDSDLSNYYLKNNATKLLPQLLVQQGELQAYAKYLLYKGDLDDSDRKSLSALLSAIEITSQQIAQETAAAITERAELKEALTTPLNASTGATGAMVASVTSSMVNTFSVTLGAEDLDGLLTSAIDANKQLLAGERDAYTGILHEAIDDADRELLLLLVVMIMIVLIALYFFVTFYISVRRHVIELRNVSERLAAGDLTVRASLATKDEMKDIGVAFNDMAQAFQRMIAASKQMSVKVVEASEQLAAASAESASGSERVASVLQDIAGGAVEQNEAAMTTSRAMEEMAHGIDQVAAASMAASESAADAEGEAGGGMQTVRAAVAQMGAIGQSVGESATVIGQLAEQGKQIDAIVKFISEIASQTSLLALNASIEAARAGEHGAGFMVVASEVKHLAEQTKQSTGQIIGVVRSIHGLSEQALRAIDQGVAETGKGRTMMEQTESAFHRILETVRHAANQMQDVSAASQQMSASTQQVASATGQMVNVAASAKSHTQEASAFSEEQLAIMEEISASSESLRMSALELERMIDRFKV
ncbi:methyl-accepting chemotaxis protein [Paenibacillus phyllosphaerae]|uniref:Methyl-accepting chemotaxis protein n=1 Tax=Paenibacillus phyllosphaerae TaxID=274593 RepID=A0A7W5FLA0_9BACL|nr:methyl-accepting chemotaxis protein [Paenibacillus phyllosphaerae]MBB3108956.1 methyl-accepting chemotaxis protein [Paenibacillus phyllosphaerae]